ncbi:hypothetical protein NCC49_003470 [Naganishia albida]|nr:hypothetical protein NCC49_003470 [Naganishia albida]
MSLLVYSPTHTRTPAPAHLDLVDTEDADALSHILFPPLRADNEFLNALLSHVGAVKGTIAFADSFGPLLNAFHHIVSKKKHTVVFHPCGTDTHLVLALPPLTEPKPQIEQTLVGAWEEFRLRYGPEPWDDERAVNWWTAWRYQGMGLRQWIAASDRDMDVRPPPEDIARDLERIGNALEKIFTDVKVVSTVVLSAGTTTTYASSACGGGGGGGEVLVRHLWRLYDASTQAPERTPSAPAAAAQATPSRWPTLGFSAAAAGTGRPSDGTGNKSSTSSSGGRWPSLSIPGFSRSSTPDATFSLTTASRQPSNARTTWLGLSSSTSPVPADLAPARRTTTTAVVVPRVVASTHLEDLDDALAEDIHASGEKAEWRVEEVWLPSPSVQASDVIPGALASSVDRGKSRGLARHALVYTVFGEVLLALILDTTTPAGVLVERLNAPLPPNEGQPDEIHLSVRALAPAVRAHASRKSTSSPAEEAHTIDFSRSPESTHFASTWRPAAVLPPAADTRAAKGRRRDVTVDDAGAWARGLLMTIDHARQLLARTGNVWIAAARSRGTEREEEAHVVAEGKEGTSIMDAEYMLRQVMDR